MEYLQAGPGEDEEAAWKRMRGRLGTGKHLDETYLLLPAAVPAAHGFPVQPGTGGTPPSMPPGGLFPPPGGDGAAPGGTTAMPPPGGSIFGGTPPATVVHHTAPPTSPLNLIGKVEGWGIGPATNLRTVSVKVAGATGAQLQKLLRSLPDGLTYELNLEKEEG
jgi:hypothetical protein